MELSFVTLPEGWSEIFVRRYRIVTTAGKKADIYRAWIFYYTPCFQKQRVSWKG